MYLLPILPVALKFLTHNPILKADSGVTQTYLQLKHASFLQSKHQLQNGPYTTLPDNSKIQATIKGTLPLHPSLSLTALVYPNFNNEFLLSIGQLCDDGCIAIFEKSKLSILKNGKIILSGHRNLTDGL